MAIKDVYLLLDMSYKGLRPNCPQQGNSLKFGKITQFRLAGYFSKSSFCALDCVSLKGTFSSREIKSYMIGLLYVILGCVLLVFK